MAVMVAGDDDQIFCFALDQGDKEKALKTWQNGRSMLVVGQCSALLGCKPLFPSVH